MELIAQASSLTIGRVLRYKRLFRDEMFTLRAAAARALVLAVSMVVLERCSAPLLRRLRPLLPERQRSVAPSRTQGDSGERHSPRRHAASPRPGNIYAANRPGNLSPSVARFPARVYVPNSGSNTVDVIDPATFKVIEHFRGPASRSTSRRRTI